tara:strand:+ start:2215 stop:3123 length:909 start_codon:yes stop_codon:yes gene_type:complete
MIQINRYPADRLLSKAFPLYKNAKNRCYFCHIEWQITTLDKRKEICNLEEISSLQKLKSNLNILEGQIFILHDYDIIGIIKAAPAKDIYAAFDAVLKDLSISKDHLKLNLIDLGTHFNQAEVIIDNKAYSLENFELDQQMIQKKVLKEKLKQAQKEHILKFDPQLIETISERREKQKKSVLLVEDDAFSRKLVKNVIGKEYRLIEAENTYEALIAYVLNAPDIVFLDINLPDDTGINIIHKIKEYDPDAFIVMLSGNAYRSNITQALTKGAKGFIGKPFNKKRLLDALNLSPHIREKELQIH